MERNRGDDVPLTSTEKTGMGVTISHSPSSPSAPSIRSQRSSLRSQTPRHHFWKAPTASNIFTFIFDIILALLPCMFILLAIAAILVDNQPFREGISNHVYEAARVAPTLFPIIFAAVVGRLMRNYALWRAERGEKLGFIEQLHGSQNLVSALERAYLLPGLGLASIVVVVLWAMSPLGGQSSSRVLRPDGREHVTTGSADVYYYNSSAIPSAGGLFGSNSIALLAFYMNGILGGSLLSLMQVKDQDLWGNVKIPYLDSVIDYTGNKMTNGWYDMAAYGKTSHDYSALTGIVAATFVSDVSSSFVMQSTYYNLTCEGPEVFNDTDAFGAWAGPLFRNSYNISEYFGVVDYPNGVWGRTFGVDTNWNGSSVGEDGMPSPDTPFNLVYASRWTGTQISAFNCTVGWTHVELDILNDASGSHVRGVRPTTTPEVYADWLPFWCTYGAGSYIQGLLGWMESAIPLTYIGQISPVDSYVSGSDTPFVGASAAASTSTLDYSDPNYYLFPNTDNTLLARRIASILNTGWQTSFLTGSLTTIPNDNETLWQQATIPDFNDGGSVYLGYAATRATASTSLSRQVNSANILWVTITIVLSIVLLLCAVASLVIKYRTYSPDVLGFVSSMTRDNPNFDKIPGSEQMDGLGYAKKMSNVRVQLDVGSGGFGNEGQEENYHITLRNLGHAR